MAGKLSALRITKLSKPGRYGDGGGLYLQVSKWRTKSFIFRWMRDGRSRSMGLGSTNTISLADARERARYARRQLLDGSDPVEVRHKARGAERMARARAITFRQCADRYLETHSARWKNAKSIAQWKSTMERFALPVFGAMAVDEVDTAQVLKALRKVWAERPETAQRLRGRIQHVIDWATAHEFRSGENPARWQGHLDKLLPARAVAVKHLAAMPVSEIPSFMAQLRSRDSISARALELTILCATRTGETTGAQWPEMDLKAGSWSVPASRMKMGRAFRIPLSDRATELLKALPHEKGSAFVFPGAKEKAPLSNAAMLELLKGMRPGITVHGFRSSFRDWCAEQAKPRELAESALAHVVGDQTESAYFRSDLFDRRRELMADWSAYCSSMRVNRK